MALIEATAILKRIDNLHAFGMAMVNEAAAARREVEKRMADGNRSSLKKQDQNIEAIKKAASVKFKKQLFKTT